MPDPFQMLAQSDQSTAQLFGVINNQIEKASAAKIDLLNEQSRMGVNMLQLSQAQQRIDLQRDELEHNQRMGEARLGLDRGRIAFGMESDLVKLKAEDNQLKIAAIDRQYSARINNAFMIGERDLANQLIEEKLAATERLSANGIGDLSGLYGSLDTVKTDGVFGGFQISNKYEGSIRSSVFGGPNDPDDNGISGITGRSNNEFPGVAIPKKILSELGIDPKNAMVRATVNGKEQIYRVADFGTAEWVWDKNGRPVLDLNEKAIAQAGGTVVKNSSGQTIQVKNTEVSAFEIFDPTNPDSAPKAIPTTQANQLVEASRAAGQTAVELKDKFDYIDSNQSYEEHIALVASQGMPKENLAMLDARIKAHAPFFKELRQAGLVSLAVNNDPNVTGDDSSYLDRARAAYVENGGTPTAFTEVANLWAARNSANQSSLVWMKNASAIPAADPDIVALRGAYMGRALGYEADAKHYDDKLRELVGMPPLPAAPEAAPEPDGTSTLGFGGKRNPIVERQEQAYDELSFGDKLKRTNRDTTPHKADAIITETKRLIDDESVIMPQNIYDLSDEQSSQVSKEASLIKSAPTNRIAPSSDFLNTINNIKFAFNQERLPENEIIQTFADYKNKFYQGSFSMETLGEVMLADNLIEHEPVDGIIVGAANYASSPRSTERRDIANKAKAAIEEILASEDKIKIARAIANMKTAIVIERLGSSKL